MMNDPATFAIEERTAAAKRAVGKSELPARIAKELGVSETVIRFWKKLYLEEQSKTSEMRMLKQRLAKLELAVDFYKKSFAMFPIDSPAKYSVIEKYAPKWRIVDACALFGVAPHYFYLRDKHQRTDRYIEDPELIKKATEVFIESNRTYGPDRIAAALKKSGFRISTTNAYYLMRSVGLVSVYGQRNSKAKHSARNYSACPNLFPNGISVERPNQVWVIGFVFVLTDEGRLRVCGIMDAYSHRLIDWCIKPSIGGNTAAVLLKHAVQERESGLGLKLHSSQSIPLFSIAFKRATNLCGCYQSMSAMGHSVIRGLKDDFFVCLKEYIQNRHYSERKQACDDIAAYVQFYNHTRKHPKLEGTSPENFEAMITMEPKTAPAIL